MKTTIEFRSSMSRAELFRALQVTLEAAARLAPRMTPAELQRVANLGAALAAAADDESARRGPRTIQFARGDGRGERAALVCVGETMR